MSEEILTPEELEQFARRGYVRIANALNPDYVTQVQEYVWSRFAEQGVLRDDPTTWGSRDEITINKDGLDKAVRAEIAPRLEAAVNQLLGAGTWKPLKTLGGLLMTLPKNPLPAWEIVTRIWHTDNDPRSSQKELNELMLFTFYSSVAPHGGGTLVLSGSHRLAEAYLAENPGVPFNVWQPYLAELTGAKERTRTQADFMEKETEICGIPVQVAELTGEPGDAILCHPALLHATSLNSLPAPRLMRRTNFRHKRL